jgi:hypothetical protein
MTIINLFRDGAPSAGHKLIKSVCEIIIPSSIHDERRNCLEANMADSDIQTG